ncbi:FtsK/SpoIIIE domain-containing protein [Arthrobacter sp. TMP15]|uniref:FtsK/SpoIIIE domain-containing protein n=1 Tax=Arthrobacter sp. TMP15 TaxID=3140789 RepID=UPI0031BB7D75
MLLELTLVAGVPAAETTDRLSDNALFSPTELTITWPPGIQEGDCSGLSLQQALAKRWAGNSFTVDGILLSTLMAGIAPLVNGAIVVASRTKSPGVVTAGGSSCSDANDNAEAKKPGDSAAAPEKLTAGQGLAAVLAVSSGPNAGAVFALHRGSYTLGRGHCQIRIADPAISRHHGTLIVGAHNITLTTAHGSAGFMIRCLAGSPTAEGTPLKDTMILQVGHSILCGNSCLELRFRDGGLFGSASVPAQSRTRTKSATGTTWPLNPAALETIFVQNPSGASRGRMPLLIAGCLPLVIGIVLALLTGSWMFLAFSAMGAITVLVPLFSGTKHRKALQDAVLQAARQDADRRSQIFPDAGTLTIAVQAGSGHPRARPPCMAAALRVGTANEPAAVALSPTDPLFSAPLIPGLPFSVLLGDQLVTVCGPPSPLMALLRFALMQLDAAAISVVLVGPAHTLPLAARFLPNTVLTTSAQSTVKALDDLGQNDLHRDDIHDSHDTEYLLGVLIIVNETIDPLAFSIPGLCILHFAGLDPGLCSPSTLVQLRVEGTSMIGTFAGRNFVPDGVPEAVFDSYARCRCTPCSVSESRVRKSLSTNSLPLPEDSTIAALQQQWKLSAAAPLRPIAVGQSRTGPTLFDFQHDGPHLLVAGTTGSGKSEFLRTLVGSLAAAHSPADLQFIFIDFKGGAGLGVLTKLPHTSSLITDLSGQGMDRTLASLGAELSHREAALAAVEASESDQYRSMVRHHIPPVLAGEPGHHAMTHLVIVVDEFRVLVDQFPDAMIELMRIAALGRSLGIHLVLATQRPQGAINADIRANITSSICLRVQSTFDSSDVLGSGVAASISVNTPGRAYISRAASTPEEFQSATLYLPVTGTCTLPLVQCSEDRLRAVPSSSPGSETPSSDAGAVGALLTRAWQQLCASEVTLLAAPAIVAAELPAVVDLTAGDLTAVDHIAGDHPTEQGANTTECSVKLGVIDVPQSQSLESLHWQPQLHSHLAFFGTGSQTSAAIALVVSQLLANNAVATTNTQDTGRPVTPLLYLLDGDGSLASFAACPWVGSRITPENLRTAWHLVGRLAETAKTSTKLFVLCITDWGRWVTAFRSSPWQDAEDRIAELVRFSQPNLVVVVSGGRELLTAAFLAAVPNRAFLSCGTTTETTMLWPKLPRFNPMPGRAAIAGPINAQGRPGGGTSMRIAQLGKAPGSGDVPALAQRNRATGTLLIEPLPTTLSMAQMTAVTGGNKYATTAPVASGRSITLGLGGDGHQVVEVVLVPGGVLAVIGGPSAGKTSLINALTLLNGSSGCDFTTTSKRPSSMKHVSMDQTGAGSILWLDDAASLSAQELLQATRSLASGAAIVAAFTYPGPAVSALPLEWGLRAAQQGVVLRPQRPSDGDLFGVRLDTAGAEPLGRGVLLDHGHRRWFQFPSPEMGVPEVRF